MFIQVLTNDDFSKESFFSGIKPYDVFWNEVEMRQSITYGPCYIIPYGIKEDKKVIGAAYYPVDYIGVNKDNGIGANFSLNNPIFVNSDVMNNEIKMNEKFLYSHFFNNLKNKGLTPDEDLLKYMYLFRNQEKQEPNISNIESSSSTRAQLPGGFVVNIIWFANLTFGEWNSHVILDVPHSTALNYLESLASTYSTIHCQPIHVVYYGGPYHNVGIGLRTTVGYVASEMFIGEFLRDFASLMCRDSTIGLTCFDFEFYVDDGDWPVVTGNTTAR